MTNAEFAILTLIFELPRHGYEIEKTIDERGMREWTEIGFSSIYYQLNKLERDGLVESRTEQQAGRGPARKVYYITTAGKRECKKETLKVLSTPHRRYAPVLLGLANFSGIATKKTIASLKEYREELVKRIVHVSKRRDAQLPLPSNVDAMFDHSLTMMKAEKNWVEKLVQKLKDEDGKI